MASGTGEPSSSVVIIHVVIIQSGPSLARYGRYIDDLFIICAADVAPDLEDHFYLITTLFGLTFTFSFDPHENVFRSKVMFT